MSKIKKKLKSAAKELAGYVKAADKAVRSGALGASRSFAQGMRDAPKSKGKKFKLRGGDWGRATGK